MQTLDSSHKENTSMTTTDILPPGTQSITPPMTRVTGYGVGGGLNTALRTNKGRSEKHNPVVMPSLDHIPQDYHRTISTLLAHLKYAQDMLGSAEKKLSEQQDRISLLEDQATTDDLTGIKNRRGFYESFLRELECCQRGTSKGGLLVMIDLDNFKSVNDTHGHLAGDAALKLVARTLIGEIRRIDMAARIGGDEFVLMLSNTTITDATPRAQAIGWQMNNLSLAWNGQIIPIQASLGIKSFAAGDEPEKILNVADGMLYAMKSERKNKSFEEVQHKV